MKENVPNLEKEIDLQDVQKAQNRKKLDPRRNKLRHTILNYLRLKVRRES